MFRKDVHLLEKEKKDGKVEWGQTLLLYKTNETKGFLYNGYHGESSLRIFYLS